MTNFTRSVIFFFVGIAALAFVLNCVANWMEMQPSLPEQKFEVVDTYKNCSVVRYTPDGSARYAYFLDCGR
jgi:hypothetical protein